MSWSTFLKNPKVRGWLVFVVAMGILYPSFQHNAYGAATDRLFNIFGDSSDAIVFATAHRAEAEGIGSTFDGMGQWLKDDDEWIDRVPRQFNIYLEAESTDGTEWVPYESQIGTHGVGWSVADQALRTFTDSPIDRFNGLKAIASLLAAAVLAWLAVLIYREFGLTAAALVTVTTALSTWVVVFAQSTYFVLWLMYLPIVAALYLLSRESRGTRVAPWLLYGGLSALFALRLSTGYEYMSTIAIGVAAAFVYFAIKDDWGWVKAARRIGVTAGSFVVAFVLVQFVHVLQIMGAHGTSFSEALSERIERANERTQLLGQTADNPTAADLGADSGTWDVVRVYFDGAVIEISAITDSPVYYGYTVLHVTLTLALLTALAFLAPRAMPAMAKEAKRLQALAAMSWFALLAPLSWLVLARGHSYVHPHLNHILWSLPYTLFVFAFFGLLLAVVGRELVRARAAAAEEAASAATKPAAKKPAAKKPAAKKPAAKKPAAKK